MAAIQITQLSKGFGTFTCMVTIDPNHTFRVSTTSNNFALEKWLEVTKSGLKPLYCSVGCSQNEGEDFASTIHLCIEDRVLIYKLGDGDRQVPLALRSFLMREDVLFLTHRPKNIFVLSQPPHSLYFPETVVNVKDGLPKQERHHTLQTLFERELNMVIPNLYNDMNFNWRAQEYTQDQLLLASVLPYGAYLLHLAFVKRDMERTVQQLPMQMKD